VTLKNFFVRSELQAVRALRCVVIVVLVLVLGVQGCWSVFVVMRCGASPIATPARSRDDWPSHVGCPHQLRAEDVIYVICMCPINAYKLRREK
jgi:hypothetical protein